jgi:arylsulfatase
MSEITNRRQFLKTLGLGAAALTFPGYASSLTSEKGAGAGWGFRPGARPNIMIILADDMGFSDLGCYGSEINTPNIDGLAKGGLRFSQFYNAARCCPSRAALLTGLYPHEAGMGGMVNDKPAGDVRPAGSYEGYLNGNCATIAEVLRAAGYATLMSGKWHVGESRPHWPTDRGFDHYYGLISGAANYFDISKDKTPRTVRRFALDDKPVMPPNHGFYMTDAITEHAVEQLKQYAAGDRPFFQYVAYTAPHFPLHALPEDIERYKGAYDIGWDALRERRYRRLIQLGIIQKRWPLTPRDAKVRPWKALSEQEKADEAHKMAVYAAQIDRMDQGVGKILAELRRQGKDKTTLIVFLSDNGGTNEGGVNGLDYRHNGVEAGGVDSYMSYGTCWANASNTPFRLYKKWVHEGGISTPLIAHWPGHVAAGGLTDQVGHIMDLSATCYDLAGAAYPAEHAGAPVKPLRGLSLAPVLAGKKRKGHDVLYWEHFNNKAVREGKWKAVTNDDGAWELYDMAADRSELNDLADKEPARLKEMTEKYGAWAKQVGVVPTSDQERGE